VLCFVGWFLQVADDGLEAKTVTQATNTNAGCVNGMDPNGNPCVTKQKHDPICKVGITQHNVQQGCYSAKPEDKPVLGGDVVPIGTLECRVSGSTSPPDTGPVSRLSLARMPEHTALIIRRPVCQP